MTLSQKDVIKNIAYEIGFHQVSIGSLEALNSDRDRFQAWLDRDYAASMDYMKRNFEKRMSPEKVFSGAKSAILATVSYYTEKPRLEEPFFGSVARYAVGLDYHVVFRLKMRELKEKIEREFETSVNGKPFIDSFPLYEQGLAKRHGLGFLGKNAVVITPKLAGSYCFVGELFTDLQLEPDSEYEGTCGACFRCGDACPTDAIAEPGYVDSNLCISYLTIENRDEIPLHLRSKLGDWVFGCDICQEVCPYNQRPLQTPWKEFLPEAGFGHSLDLMQLLDIKSEAEFHKKFVHSALRRPKRRGLIRNALCVVGNHFKEMRSDNSRFKDNGSYLPALEKLKDFVLDEPDAMLRDHAFWALAQAGEKSTLLNFHKKEENETNKKRLASYIDAL